MSKDAASKATPTGRSNDESAEGLAMMNDAAGELGVSFTAPVVPKKQTAPVDGEETDEERQAREDAGIDENGDTAEDRAAAAAAEKGEGDEGDGESKETDDAEDDDSAEETDEDSDAKEGEEDDKAEETDEE